MKRVLIILLAVSFTCTAMASGEPIDRLDKRTIQAMDDSQMQARYEYLEERIMEIKAMDLRDLAYSERRAVKKELRYIQKEMHALNNGGIYISTTALVIIIILLIIF